MSNVQSKMARGGAGPTGQTPEPRQDAPAQRADETSGGVSSRPAGPLSRQTPRPGPDPSGHGPPPRWSVGSSGAFGLARMPRSLVQGPQGLVWPPAIAAGQMSPFLQLRPLDRPGHPGMPARTTPTLPHWNPLATDRPRGYEGHVYDPTIVKRVFPDEIHGWEHGRTTATLVDLARHDAWEDHAVPPIHLAYSEEGLQGGGRRCHYAIVDGHHRLNAARAASTGREPAGIPAIVTDRWTPNDRGSLLGYRGMPNITSDPSLPRTWNAGGKALSIHAPEKIERKRFWGAEEMMITLPGSSVALSLKDIAKKLNAHTRPDQFLLASRGDTLRVRVTLQDVYGRESPGSKMGDLTADLEFRPVDITSNDWQSILRDTAPLAKQFGSHQVSQYPLLTVQVQQDPDRFVTDSL